MTDFRFTVLMPTTGEKGIVIQYAIESVLQQSHQEFELFIIGDGAGASTREVVEEYAGRDSRIRYFDFEKQAVRAAPQRDQLLRNEASGNAVCYLCDRDLWTPDHLQMIAEALASCDFAYTQSLLVKADKFEFGPPLIDLRRAEHRQFFLDKIKHESEFLPLSCGAHTMDMYRRLPHGWRDNYGLATDYFMWMQFLQVPDCRVSLTKTPTLLWFPSGHWGREASEEKSRALENWLEWLSTPGWEEERWKLAFQKLYVRGSVFRVRAAKAEHELGINTD